MYKKLSLLVLTFLIPLFSFSQTPPDSSQGVFSIAVSVNQAVIDHNARNVDIFYEVESRDRQYGDLRIGVEFLNENDLSASPLYTYYSDQFISLTPGKPKNNIIRLTIPEFLIGKVVPRLTVYAQNDFLVAFRDMPAITLPTSTYEKITIKSCDIKNQKVTCSLSRKLDKDEALTLNLKKDGKLGAVVEVQRSTAQASEIIFTFATKPGSVSNAFLQAFVSTADTKLYETYVAVPSDTSALPVLSLVSAAKEGSNVVITTILTGAYGTANESVKVNMYDIQNKICHSQEQQVTESIQTFSFNENIGCDAVRAIATLSVSGQATSARQVSVDNLFVVEETDVQSVGVNNYINTKNMTLLALILAAIGLGALMRGRKSAVVAVFVVLAVFVGGVEKVDAGSWGILGPWSLQPWGTIKMSLNCNGTIFLSATYPSTTGTWTANGSCSVTSSGGSVNINDVYAQFTGAQFWEHSGEITCGGSTNGGITCYGGGTFAVPSNLRPGDTGWVDFSPMGPDTYPVSLFDRVTGNLVGSLNINTLAHSLRPATSHQYTLLAPPPVCRNGILEAGEQCDDGNSTNGDSCTNLCRNAMCGDSIRRYDITNTSNPAYEQCDAGPMNGPSPRACSTSCRLNPPTGPVCGDGIVNQASEQCDGTTPQCATTGTQCTSSCQIVTCNPNGEFACAIDSDQPSAPVNSNVILRPREISRIVGGYWGSCEITTTPNSTIYRPLPFTSFYQSDPIVLGLNTFLGRCVGYDENNNPQTIQCTPATVTGTGVGGSGHRCGSCSTAGAACAVGEPNCYADTNSCNTSCAALPTPINIGWDNGYVEKNKTVNLSQGETTTSQTLFVTTGGRTGCSIVGNFSSSNTNGINTPTVNPNFVMGSSYAVVDRPAGGYAYTLNCQGDTAQATLNVNAYSGSVTRYHCSPAGSTGPCTQTTCAANDTGCISSTYGDATSCEAATSCDAVDQCSNGVCSALCPQNCTQDLAECVGGQTTITSPANGRVLSGQNFTVNFSFRNIGNTLWSTPTYRVNTTSSTFPASWRMAFGTQALSPSPIAGSLGGYGYTNPYSKTFTAPIVSTETTFTLGFTLEKNGVPFSTQCLVNGTGDVVVRLPQCSDGIDNDSDGPGKTGDGKIDCQPGNEDPGCYKDGNGGGGACNPNDDDETDNTGSEMSIVANPQLIRQGGTSNVTFTCDASTWRLTGPQVANITGISRDETSLGCNEKNVFCGTEALTDKVFPALNVMSKEVYTLSCGGRERSATISVIKINEV